MAPKYDQVVRMSDDELREQYDNAAHNTVVGTSFWREELAFRIQMRAANEAHGLNQRIADLTKETVWLARVSVTASIVALVVAVLGLVFGGD